MSTQDTPKHKRVVGAAPTLTPAAVRAMVHADGEVNPTPADAGRQFLNLMDLPVKEIEKPRIELPVWHDVNNPDSNLKPSQRRKKAWPRWRKMKGR